MVTLSERFNVRSAAAAMGSPLIGVLASVLARARQRFAARRGYVLSVRDLERLGLNPHMRRDLGLDY